MVCLSKVADPGASESNKTRRDRHGNRTIHVARVGSATRSPDTSFALRILRVRVPLPEARQCAIGPPAGTKLAANFEREKMAFRDSQKRMSHAGGKLTPHTSARPESVLSYTTDVRSGDEHISSMGARACGVQAGARQIVSLARKSNESEGEKKSERTLRRRVSKTTTLTLARPVSIAVIISFTCGKAFGGRDVERWVVKRDRQYSASAWPDVRRKYWLMRNFDP